MATATGVVDNAMDGPGAYRQLILSIVLGTIGSVGMWSVVVVLPTIQAEFGIDRAGASLPYTATMIGFAVGNVAIGRMVDRVGIRLPIILAACSLGAGFSLAALSTQLWHFAMLQGVLIGLGAAATFGPLMANISHWFRRRRGIAVAGVASGNYLAGAIWPPLIQAAVEAEGWRTTHVGLGLICVLAMVPLAMFLAPNPGHSATKSKTQSAEDPPVSVDLSPRFIQTALVLAGIGCCVAMSMPQVHIVAYCADLGYGVARGAAMLSLMLAGGVVSRLVFGHLADKIGGIRTLLFGSVLQCISLFLFLPFDGLVSLYVVSLIFGLSQGGIVPSYALIVREYHPAREAGQRVGLVIMATVIGMALGGWLSGLIFDLTGSYQTAFINGIAFNMFNIAVVVMILWRSKLTPDGAPVASPA